MVGAVHEHYHSPTTPWREDHVGVEVARVAIMPHDRHAAQLSVLPAHAIGAMGIHLGGALVQLGDPFTRKDSSAFVASPIKLSNEIVGHVVRAGADVSGGSIGAAVRDPTP